MFRPFLICCLLLHAGLTLSRAHDFVAVFFDDQSAKELHVDAPLPRDLVAKMITKFHDAGARGLVIKWFLDLPRDKQQDEALAKALCLMPTVLQACHKEDGSTNALPERFRIAQTNDLELKEVMSSERGYLPLPIFSKCARGVGFVDLAGDRTDSVPLVEGYQDNLVKSLYVNALELELRETAVYKGDRVIFGAKTLSFNSLGEHRIKALPELDYVPFHDVLKSRVSMNQFKDKVIILGYDGRRIHSIKTKWGEIKAHRLLVQSLLALTDDLETRRP
jgi:CHASE2 domain-containing sensor protein